VGIDDATLIKRTSGREKKLSDKAKNAAEQAKKTEQAKQAEAEARKRSGSRRKDEDDSKGIIIQTKYDGDRLQAHVRSGGQTVKLFTRRGVDVTEIYSNIAKRLQKWYTEDGACVLDGELIVIDSASGKPLAWSNEKWRHNHHDADSGEPDSVCVSELAREAAEDDRVVMLEYSEAALGEVWEDSGYDVSFVPLSNLRYFYTPRLARHDEPVATVAA
jgi:hypothetical protein